MYKNYLSPVNRCLHRKDFSGPGPKRNKKFSPGPGRPIFFSLFWPGVQNYLQYKYKNSKSVIKGMSQSELWKKKLDEDWVRHSIIIKNINDFCLKFLMKTERHISLAHLQLLSTKWFVIKLLSVDFKTLSLFSQPKLTRNIISLPFFVARPVVKKLISLFAGPARSKNHLSYAGAARPVGKNHPSCAGPLEKNHLSYAGPLEKLPLKCRHGPGPCQRIARADLYCELVEFLWSRMMIPFFC